MRLTLILIVVVCALSLGCVSTPNGVLQLSVAEAAAMVEAGATFYDANGKSTRELFGTVPGAVRMAAEKYFGDASRIKYCLRLVAAYEVETRIDGKHRELHISPTGRILKDPGNRRVGHAKE